MFVLKAMSCRKGGGGRETDMSVLEVGRGAVSCKEPRIPDLSMTSHSRETDR